MTAAALFYRITQTSESDHAALSKLVSAEVLDEWGGFIYAANTLAGPYGISNVVRHPVEDYAIVKFLPNAEPPFFYISTFQVVQGGHELVFRREVESWKIWALR